MTWLDVPGARLYYETRGSGRPLLMIPGANGHADVFAMVREHLAARFTVVTYDRRGFSRSRLDGPQDYEHRLATDADDARRLIEDLGEGPAIVFGSSSGGIVALEVLVRHPGVVRTVVPYEPAAVSLLPDGRERIDFFHRVYDLYRASGVETAIREFREKTFAAIDVQTMARVAATHRNEYAEPNAIHWFEHELRQYPAARLDVDALTVRAGQISLASGRESRGRPAYEVNVDLGRRLGLDVAELPGGHVGFVSHPAEFAASLLRVLKQS